MKRKYNPEKVGKMAKIIGIAAAVLVVAIVLLVIFAGRKDVNGVKLLGQSRVTCNIETTGELAPLMKYSQCSAYSGKIKSIDVNNGDSITEGQIVGYMYGDSIGSSVAIVAEVTGKICRIDAVTDKTVKQGDVLFEIVDDKLYTIDFSVGKWSQQIKLGTTMQLYNSDGKELDFSGKVVRFSEDDQNYYYTLCAEGNPFLFYQDFTNVNIKYDFGFASGYAVPSSALVERDGKTYVFVYSKLKAHLTEVKVGIRNSNTVCITGGLKNDQTVITTVEGIEDGTKVKVNVNE